MRLRDEKQHTHTPRAILAVEVAMHILPGTILKCVCGCHRSEEPPIKFLLESIDLQGRAGAGEAGTEKVWFFI